MNCAFLSPFPRRCLLTLSLALGVAIVPRLSAEEKASAATGPVVELPKFVVTDDRALPEPESWHYAEIPGFEVLTNASDKATRRLLKDFAMFRDALSLVWPVPDRSTVPTSLILCGKGGKFDAFMPDGKSSADRALASLFLKNKEQTAIVLDMEATTLNVLATDTSNDAATGTDSNYISVDHNKQLYREYVHYLLSKNEPRLPAWLEEGMAQIIMAMQFEKKYIVFGKLEDPNTVSAQAGAVAAMNALTAADDPDGIQLAGAPAEDRDFNAALQRRALVPFPKFLAVTHDSPEAINPLGNNVWAKQCYAFVHMCIYGRNKKYQKPFMTFLSALGKEQPSEELFKRCFNMTYKQMTMELVSYISFTDYKHQEYTLKGEGLTSGPPLDLREATQGEIGRIKGEALALAGHKGLALVELGNAYKRGERDPRLLAALGLYDQANGEEARGRKFIEAAVAAKVDRPRANLEVARYRFNDALAKPGSGQQFSPEQVQAVLAPLFVPRRQPARADVVAAPEAEIMVPLPLPEVYELMTDTWAHSAILPKEKDMMYLISGVQQYPSRLRMLYLVAQLCGQTNMIAPAHSLADYGIKISLDAKSRGMFESLKASLPPDPSPAPVPAAKADPAPKKKS